MQQPLTEYRSRYLETLLDFLWREWTALGMAGHDRTPRGHVVDPEAILLLTCTVGRYDPRLFDEVMDWLLKNGRFINVQRLRNILRKEDFRGGPVLAAIADWLSQQGNPAKWKLLATPRAREGHPSAAHEAGPIDIGPNEHDAREPSRRHRNYTVREDSNPAANHQLSTANVIGTGPAPLFYLPDGRPLPVLKETDETFRRHGLRRAPLQARGYSGPFPTDTAAARLLRLRAIFGVSVRCDVLNYLALNGTGHPRGVARELYYAQKSVYDVLADLERAGAVVSAKGGRERTYRLTPEGLRLLGDKPAPANWVNWPVYLAAAETVWYLVDRLQGASLESGGIAAEIRGRMHPVRDRLNRARWAPVTESGEHVDAMALLDGFRNQFEAVTR